MLVIRAACELGKFPAEVMESMDMDDLIEFAGYLSLMNPRKDEGEGDVEKKLIKSFGKPS